jgi:hypothetical protein
VIIALEAGTMKTQVIASSKNLARVEKPHNLFFYAVIHRYANKGELMLEEPENFDDEDFNDEDFEDEE